MRAQYRYHLRRILKMSLQNLARNGLLSTATALMMGLILFIFNVVLVLNLLSQSSLGQISEKVDLLVYLKDSTSVLESTELLGKLEELPYVLEVNYMSKDEALQDFISFFPEKQDPFTLYQLENPIPSSIQVITDSPDDHEAVLKYLDNSIYEPLLLEIESSQENAEIIANLLKVTRFTRQLILGVTLAFVLGSLLMILNAIHLSIFTRKKEIQIMQLVGARPSTIRLPFLFEGGFYGLIGALISLCLLFLFVEGTGLKELVFFSEDWNFLSLLLLESLASIAVGVFSSLFAINYYLKRTLLLQT